MNSFTKQKTKGKELSHPALYRDLIVRGSDDARKFAAPDQPHHLNYFTERAPIFTRTINSAMTVKKVSSQESQNDQDAGDAARATKSGPVTPVPLSQALPNAQVSLPGEKLLVPESSRSPGAHTVYRSADERSANPDRLNLDRRRLLFCPILEGEENLRLLNYQHNLISKIENVSNLRRLIFLDLYDNDIQEISNLDSLKSLRVLMLGKNRISKIENLDMLIKLDVLDLHGNRIKVIENLNHLRELRVLNLAGNVISCVGQLTGMDSLTELNLRRNKIRQVNDIDMLPCLQRLFLSFNDISRFEEMQCVFDCTSLMELAIDGNPLSQIPQYRYNVLKRAPHITQLDMKRVMDDERRSALTMARKEEEKKREFTKMSVMKEKRRQAISNAKRQWEVSQSKALSHSGKLTAGHGSSDAQVQHVGTYPTTAEQRRDSDSPHRAADDDKQHLAQLEGDTLSLYGQGALEAFERNWGVQAAGTITTVLFRFMDFDEIIKHLHKLRVRFPSVQSLVFNSTNIHSLRQLHGLASLRRLEHLTIQNEGNPITSLSLWRLYAIFRLSSYDLKSINGVEISEEEVTAAEHMFAGVTGEISKLPETMLHYLISEQQRKAVLCLDETSKEKKTGNAKKHNPKAALVYNVSEDSKSYDKTPRDLAARTILEAKQEAIYCDKKRAEVNAAWPTIFCDIVARAVADMADLKLYMKQSMDQLDRD